MKKIETVCTITKEMFRAQWNMTSWQTRNWEILLPDLIKLCYEIVKFTAKDTAYFSHTLNCVCHLDTFHFLGFFSLTTITTLSLFISSGGSKLIEITMAINLGCWNGNNWFFPCSINKKIFKMIKWLTFFKARKVPTVLIERHTCSHNIASGT